MREEATAVSPLAEDVAEQTPAAETAAAVEVPNGRPGFFDLLAAMTSEEWERCIVYLYRLAPRIDSQSESAYIEKRNSPFDVDDVLQAHGSGRYMAILKDTSVRKKVADHKFSVYHQNLPPKVDPAHVLRVPENESYWNSWGKQTAEPTNGTHAAAAPVNGGAMQSEAAVAAIREMAEVAKRAQDAPERPVADPRLMELWESTAKDRDELAQKLADRQTSNIDPMKVLDQVLSTAERLRGPSSQESPMILVREVLSTVKAMQEAGPQGKAVNPMESFKEFVATAQLMKEAFGNPPSPAENEPLQDATPTWVQALGAIAPALTPLIQAVAARLLSPAPLPDAPPSPHTPPVNPKPEIAPAANKETAAPPTFIEQIAPLLLNALSIGADGGRFADSICVMYGSIAYQAISALGKEGILNAMKAYGPLWQQIASIEPQVATFIEEFLAYGDEQAEDEQTGEHTVTATA